MGSTTVVVAVVVAGLVLQVILAAACLRFGLRWHRVPGVTLGRLVTAAGAAVAIGPTVLLLVHGLMPLSARGVLAVDLLGLGVASLLPVAIVMGVFRTSPTQSLLAWLPTLLVTAALGQFGTLVVRRCVCEAFVTPANAMAPTLLGPHGRGRCPECGQPGFCSPVRGMPGREAIARIICGRFHVHEGVQVARGEFPADSFLVAKYLAPRRWDAVVFRYPEEPAVLYTMRVVGLPGETIHIAADAVWADGRRLEPPKGLRGIRYLDRPAGMTAPGWGSPERPARLGADEYFVLGDFSAQARDSRAWDRGAADHPPYAVPGSHIHGVITHVIWPPPRWRVLR